MFFLPKDCVCVFVICNACFIKIRLNTLSKKIISSVFYQNLESYKTDSKLMDFNGAWRALVIHLTSLLLYCIH